MTDEAEDGPAISERGSEDPRPVTSAVLTFVDLAGSERVSSAALDDSNQRTRLLEVRMSALAAETLCSIARKAHPDVTDLLAFSLKCAAPQTSCADAL